MKPLKPAAAGSSLLSNSITEIKISEPLNKSTFLTTSDGKVEAFCLRCPGRNCLASADKFGLAIELCPTGAITFDNESKDILISNACFGCGLCAISCPTGAITINQSGKAEVGLNVMSIDMQDSEKSQWEKWIKEKIKMEELEDKQILTTAEYFANTCVELKGNSFYKTVESLLRLLGYDAKMSNLGDTSNRIDLIIRTEIGNVPVEIKSFAETPTINLKSVQQAVENKLLISRLDGDHNMTSLSSLVIGFAYPSERTGIEEHIIEIEEAYGIRVGVLSLARLWELLLTKNFSKDFPESVDLVEASGIL
jgi:Fe-S-cluster-containing hydrogenase component 2